MRKYRAVIYIAVLLVLTGVIAFIHFNTREEVTEGAIEVVAGADKYVVDIKELTYEQVTGSRVNGKGEEIEVEALGVLLKKVLEETGIAEYKNISVVADDAYSAEISAEELKGNVEAYLIQEEGEERLRLVVFGDKDSKRSVSNVAQIIVN